MLAFVSDSLLAIALSATVLEQAAALFPDGPAYWAKQEAWIRTGHDPEYELASWLPIHFQLLALACFVRDAPLSLGLAILRAGVLRGRPDERTTWGPSSARAEGLGARSLVGWHPWSICRGLCYVLLTYELVGRVGEPG